MNALPVMIDIAEELTDKMRGVVEIRDGVFGGGEIGRQEQYGQQHQNNRFHIFIMPQGGTKVGDICHSAERQSWGLERKWCRWRGSNSHGVAPTGF